MDRLREERGNACQRKDPKTGRVCGASGVFHALEFAHLEPTGLCGRGRGLSSRYHDIKKHPECYELMCVPCHRTFDLNYWRDYDARREGKQS